MPHDAAVTADVSATVLRNLKEVIKDKRRPCAQVTKNNCRYMGGCGVEKLNYSSYSPDLAPSNYLLFRNLKKYLREHQFSSDGAHKDVLTQWRKEQDKYFSFSQIYSLSEKNGSIWNCRDILLKNSESGFDFPQLLRG